MAAATIPTSARSPGASSPEQYRERSVCAAGLTRSAGVQSVQTLSVQAQGHRSDEFDICGRSRPLAPFHAVMPARGLDARFDRRARFSEIEGATLERGREEVDESLRPAAPAPPPAPRAARPDRSAQRSVGRPPPAGLPARQPEDSPAPRGRHTSDHRPSLPLRSRTAPQPPDQDRTRRCRAIRTRPHPGCNGELNDSAVLSAVRDSISGLPIPAAPRLEAITAMGRARRACRRRRHFASASCMPGGFPVRRGRSLAGDGWSGSLRCACPR
jgi:hypothetical protein